MGKLDQFKEISVSMNTENSNQLKQQGGATTEKTSDEVLKTIGDERDYFFQAEKKKLKVADNRVQQLEQEKEEKKNLMLSETLGDKVISIRKELEKIDEEINKLNIEKMEICKKIYAVCYFGLPVEHALSTFDRLLSVDGNIVSQKIIRDKKVYVALSDYSYYPGGGCGMEYGVKIFVKRGKKSDYKKIIYRDPYSSAYDDWSKAFKTIDSVKVEGDKVIVNVSSSSRKSSYTFYLEKDEEEGELLSKEAQAKFQERIDKEKERLLKLETRENGMMPSIYDLTYMQMPNPQMFNKKYEKAVIMDEATDLGKGECYIVIKTQIDANADEGIQFAWLKYKITPTSTELIDRETAYQSELKDGKRIEMRASK